MNGLPEEQAGDSGSAHRVVIVGAGFGGLYCAKKLRKNRVKVTILDRRNFHLFQPLLYQVASGSLSAGDIASPIRTEFIRYPGVTVLQTEVVDFDLEARVVKTLDAQEIPYDSLVVATGSRHSYFGHDEWERLAPGLKTVEDALEIRGRVLRAFEAAERTIDEQARRALITFIIVGGGPTGVELAGTFGELAHQTMAGEFRNFRLDDVRIILVEHAPRLVPAFDPKLSEKAGHFLQQLGVEVMTGAGVTHVDEDSVEIENGGTVSRVPTKTVLWAAGNHASPLGGILADKAGIETDRSGRLPVDEWLNLPGHPEVFVIGDLAHFPTPDGRGLPALAPVAIQEGRHVARTILDREEGRKTAPFRFRDKGTLAVVGRNKAIARIGRLKLSGFPAWLAWVFVHLLSLIEYSNRVLVLVQWASYYFTRRRGARLITGEGMLHPQNATEQGAPPGALPGK